ncbi:hypothetical protein I7I50_02383 [Histoplasma capsulatum G186AR]|uniref:Uncharacterized protein n=1 Tax=Ajellomyces capsulatus TaxID=5037 RepID=A0A8H7Z8M5_AJECA|nr:hypothetical protein I7I52_00953 [Histoplasma capsulatum]QSS71524.1 hypothetical protein I7I50_02383 [Histoplasma capsulatum G186AR]
MPHPWMRFQHPSHLSRLLSWLREGSERRWTGILGKPGSQTPMVKSGSRSKVNAFAAMTPRMLEGFEKIR